MGKSYIQLGQADVYVSIPAGNDSQGTVGWFWWYPNSHTKLQPASGDNALWGWSTNTQYISGLRSGLAVQAKELGKDYTNKMQRFLDGIVLDAPMPFLAGLKNRISGERWDIGTLGSQYASFPAQWGSQYGTWVLVDVSGLAITNETDVTAYIDPSTLFVNYSGPVVTGWRANYDFFSPIVDSVKVYLNNGDVISGVLPNYP